MSRERARQKSFEAILKGAVRSPVINLFCPGRRKTHFLENGKVIVSSGYSNDQEMSAYREYGFKGAVMKPYQMEEVDKVLRELLATG